MNVRRLLALTGVVVVAGLLPAGPALAHGAPTSPISRSAACAGGGSKTGAAACKAALKANGGAFGSFDNIRVPGVDGNDRKFVPDGQLCGGGLDAFKGLNIARDDFPATSVTSGKTLSIKYRATIAHQGSFRVYLTRQGYSPTRKLAWGDLGSKPLTDVANPPLKGGAFQFGVKLPQRTGRQILFIVWQTSNTPDTYYSCSDLAFPAAPATTAPPARKAVVKTTTRPATASPSPSTSRTAGSVPLAAAGPTSEAPEAAPNLTPVSDNTKVTLGHQILIGALVLVFGALAVAAFGRLRRKRFENR
ncbi:lytic polysaccharide monooxygenase [Actinoplanes sp. NPDC051343]|uniref:lytic polysaccharide monooxygenase n=1 Tax=Actinoplanes sp. NPDC051343 TaxID=3363906 RepID=UPI0037B8BB99